MKNFIKKLVLLTLGVLVGVVDSSVFAADAASGVVAVNGVNNGSVASASEGMQGAGVHTTPKANEGLVTDVTRLGSPDLIKDPVDRAIIKMYQSSVPVDQILRHIPSVAKKGMRYSFYSIDERPIKATLQAEVVASANGSIELTLDNPTMFSATDTIFIPSVLGYDSAEMRSTKNPLVLFVQSVDGKKVTCIPVNGKQKALGSYGCPQIPNGTAVYRMGRAASEGEVTTAAWAALPEKDELFMQIFKAQVAESSIMAESEKEVDFTFTDQEDYAIRDLRRGIEISFICGQKGYFFDLTKSRWIYTCAGIIQQILEGGQVITYNPTELASATGEKALLEKIVHPIFKGNSGSATRYLFAGSDLVASIATIPNVNKQMNATQVERKFGVDWTQIKFMSWQLNLYQHPLLDELGMSKCAFVLDLPYVHKAVFRPLSKDILELKASGQFDGEAQVWTEISSIELGYRKAHAFIKTADQFNPTKTTDAA